jgi:hypothetical protein
MKQAPLILSALALMVSTVAGHAQAPTADALLKTARFVATLQQQDLKGQIRKDARKFPVALYLRGENIQLSYNHPTSGEPIRFHMRLKDTHYDLLEIVDGKTVRFPEAKLGQAIEGTDLSYEDLAMRFLYWPKGIVEGVDKIKNQECWLLRLPNPTGHGRYAQVRVWVHKKSQALMQVVGYNKEGRPLKRFQVQDIMKVGNTYTLRRMRIDRFEPATSKSLGVTYLEFDKPKVAAPGGLR